jgi:hypothetical protein
VGQRGRPWAAWLKFHPFTPRLTYTRKYTRAGVARGGGSEREKYEERVVVFLYINAVFAFPMFHPAGVNLG